VGIVWFALGVDPMMTLAACIGSMAFFIVHGFRQNAEEQERRMLGGDMSDTSKLFYLEVVDAMFSIDSVVGAFAFTMSVPLIMIGCGSGLSFFSRHADGPIRTLTHRVSSDNSQIN